MTGLSSIALRTVALLLAIPVIVLASSMEAKSMTQGEQIYRELREMALNMSPTDLALQLDQTKVTVYGVLLDMGREGATITLTSFVSGDASLYFSTGGGIVGGVGHETVRTAAQQFVNRAQTLLGKMSKVFQFPLPTVGRARFYALTNQGVYASPDLLLDDVGNSRSEFSPLLFASNDVITQIRLTQPNTR